MGRKAGELITIFVIGGLIYGLMEVLNRGFTHITMGILGGICFVVIHILNTERMNGNLSFQMTIFISGIFITSIEFFAGEILNNIFKLNIWTYSELPLNIDGQICLLFSVLWLFVACFGILVDIFVRKKLFKQVINNKIRLTKSQITV